MSSPRRFAFALLLVLFAAPSLARAQEVVSIAEAREQGVGATVTVQGVVTRAFGDFVRFQDTSGVTGASALVVRQTSGDFYDDIQDGTIQAGAVLQVTGTISSFNGLLQINTSDLASYSVEGQMEVPAPQTITLAEFAANGGDYLSELVEIETLHFPSASGSFENNQSYDVSDGTAALTLRVQGSDETALAGTPIPSGAFTYVGIAGVFFPDYFSSPSYQLIPVRPSDVQPVPSVGFVGRSYTLAYEQGGDASAEITVRAYRLTEGQDVTVTVAAMGASGDLANFDGTETLTFSGPDPAPQTLTLTATSDADEEGIERVELTLESTDVPVASGRSTLWILDSDTATTTLYAGMEGEMLRQQIREDFGSPPTLGYDRARDTLYAVVYNQDTPEDGLGGDIVKGFYTGYVGTLEAGVDPSQALFEDGINAEHTWPQSKGAQEEPAKSDMHILVPAWGEANNARCNYPYAEIADDVTQRWFGSTASGAGEILTQPPTMDRDAYSESFGNDCSAGDYTEDGRFEPRERVRGDAARKLFYFRTIYPEVASQVFFRRQVETLMNWNDGDAPSAEEVRRNVVIASYQGDNLNPFVLDPSLAERAYGDVLDPISIAEARAQALGTAVTTQGLVTRIDSDGAYLQGETAAIYVFDDDLVGGAVSVGDSIRVTGTLDVFAGLLEITNVDAASIAVLSSGNPLPAPQTVTLAELTANGEQYEAELIRIENVTFADADVGGTFEGSTNYTVSDGSGGTLALRTSANSFYIGGTIPDAPVVFTGVLGQFNGEFDSRMPDTGYQPLVIAQGDLEGGGVGDDLLAVSFSRSFGDPDLSTGYRLVALPGDSDRPLANTINGTAGAAWQAYWDNGADSDNPSDYFVKWDGSETFTFQPGRGFWLIAEEPWTVEGSIPAVDTAPDGSYKIGLHAGWNIISNPLAGDVAWSAVEAANGGTLQPIWRFADSYTQAQTFASATVKGEAFYLLNNGGLDSLVIPAPGAAPNAVARASDRGASGALTLSTYRDGRRTSTVWLGTAPDATAGLDAHDVFAPPGRFAAASLRAPLPASARTEGARQQWLAGERLAPGKDGYSFDLVLHAAPGTSVTLRAGGLSAFARQAVVLVVPSTDKTYNLRAEHAVEITPETDAAKLRLLVGSKAQAAAGRPLPDKVTLKPGYPNPFHASVTLEYGLPEAAEVRIVVYDVLGRRVRVLVDGRRTAGHHTLKWDGQGAGGSALASGIYFVRLTADGVTRTQQIVHVR